MIMTLTVTLMKIIVMHKMLVIMMITLLILIVITIILFIIIIIIIIIIVIMPIHKLSFGKSLGSTDGRATWSMAAPASHVDISATAKLP